MGNTSNSIAYWAGEAPDGQATWVNEEPTRRRSTNRSAAEAGRRDLRTAGPVRLVPFRRAVPSVRRGIQQRDWLSSTPRRDESRYGRGEVRQRRRSGRTARLGAQACRVLDHVELRRIRQLHRRATPGRLDDRR